MKISIRWRLEQQLPKKLCLLSDQISANLEQ